MITDFMNDWATVSVGDRRFVVRRPTYQTVLTAVMLFSSEIQRLRKLIEDDPEQDVMAAIDGLLLLDGGRRVRAVLKTCVDGPLDHLVLDAAVIREFRQALLSLCSIRRILDSLDLDAFGRDADPEDAELQDGAVVALGQEFGVPPHQVMDWPYETVLATGEVLEKQRREKARQAREMQKSGRVFSGGFGGRSPIQDMLNRSRARG